MRSDAVGPDEHRHVGHDVWLGVLMVVIGLLGVLCGVLRSTTTTEMALGSLFIVLGVRVALAGDRDDRGA